METENTLEKTPKTTPVKTPKTTPVKTPKTTPVKTPKTTPVKTPKTTPYCTPYLPYTVGFGFGQRAGLVSPFWADKYESESYKYWDQFYIESEDRFFKDRHWTLREFEDDLRPLCRGGGGGDVGDSCDVSHGVFLELGCGVGNTIYPLIEEGLDCFSYAIDFSSKAIDILKKHTLYDEKRIKGIVCDITKEFPEEIGECSVDIVTMIFVLSAISPEKMDDVVRNVYKILKPGGIVLFRDYARGDLAEQRFAENQTRLNEISSNFYVRGDGTRAYFFTKEQLSDSWSSVGFEVMNVDLVYKKVLNRKEGLEMNRVWVQGRFRKNF